MPANNLVVISEILEYKYTFGRKRKRRSPDFPEIGNDCSAPPKKCLSIKKSGRYFRPESSLFRCPIASANNIRRAPPVAVNPFHRRTRHSDATDLPIVVAVGRPYSRHRIIGINAVFRNAHSPTTDPAPSFGSSSSSEQTTAKQAQTHRLAKAVFLSSAVI